MTSAYCILNGKVVESKSAQISPFDRGILYGDGAFDTMYAPNGKPFLFDEHMKRLYENLERLAITLPYETGEMAAMICELIERNGLNERDSYVRTTVTRGVHKGAMFYPSDKPTLFIINQEVPKSVKRARKTGVRCVISDVQKFTGNPLYSVKSLNFLWSVMGVRHAIDSGADDSIFFNSDGFLAECTTSNIFIVRDGRVSTPKEGSSILPGVTRDFIIELLDKQEISVIKDNITKDELMSADEVFLTSSVRGVVPVISINDKPYNIEYIRELQDIYLNSL